MMAGDASVEDEYPAQYHRLTSNNPVYDPSVRRACQGTYSVSPLLVNSVDRIQCPALPG